jgi:ureidoacrylate peracid hydrolase
MTAALLVIDMQNGFIHADGSCAAAGITLDGIDRVTASSVAMVEAARAAHLPIVYTRHQYRADFLDAPPKLLAMLNAEAAPLVAGGWDAAVADELKPLDGDTIVDKNRFDAFLYTDMEIVLRALGVRTLLVGGVVTNVCVESTVRSAAQRDFEVVVAADCCAAAPGFHDPALAAMAAVFATVTDWKSGLDLVTS